MKATINYIILAIILMTSAQFTACEKSPIEDVYQEALYNYEQIYTLKSFDDKHSVELLVQSDNEDLLAAYFTNQKIELEVLYDFHVPEKLVSNGEGYAEEEYLEQVINVEILGTTLGENQAFAIYYTPIGQKLFSNGITTINHVSAFDKVMVQYDYPTEDNCFNYSLKYRKKWRSFYSTLKSGIDCGDENTVHCIHKPGSYRTKAKCSYNSTAQPYSVVFGN